MRFPLVFPLVFLLILGSFVSIEVAPQSVFTPVPPWSTHKPRLKRSIDDSTSTADYDSLSLDQLTKLLEETKKKAENEKMDLEAANSTLIAKQTEYDKAKDDYDKKKKEWDKWKEFPVLTKVSEEAQKIMEKIDIRALEETYLKCENKFLEAEKKCKNFEEDLEDINGLAEGKDVEKSLNDESTRLTKEIDMQSQTVTSLEETKNEKETALSNLKDEEKVNSRIHAKYKCNEPEKATVAPCPDAIVELGEIKSKMQTAEDEAATATRNHKVADDQKKELESQKDRISDRLTKLGRAKNDIPGRITFAANTLEEAKSDKDLAEIPYLEAKTAKAELAKAVAAKTDADQKLREYPPDVATKESEANIAQDEAGKEKTRLERELADLKGDKDKKEKNWSATSAKVAELQQRKDEKESVSKGGMGLAAILGICITAVVVIGAVIAVAAVAFVRRKRKRLAALKQQAAVEEKESVDVKQSVDKVASEPSKSSVKADNPPVPPPEGALACSDEIQQYMDKMLSSMDDTGWIEANNDFETTVAELPPNPTEKSVSFEELPVEVRPKTRDLITRKIENVKKTKIRLRYRDVIFKMNFGYTVVSFDGHDSKTTFAPNEFNFYYNIDEAFKILEFELSSRQLRSLPDDVIPPISQLFSVIFFRSELPKLAKYERMDRRRRAERKRKAERERDSAGQDEFRTAIQPASEHQDITEKTQSVSGTQQEAGKEEPPTAVIPDDVATVTAAPKDETKQPAESAIDESLVERTAIDDPLQELTGISGTEAPVAAGGRRSDSRNQPAGKKKKKGHRKRSKDAKKGFWRKVRMRQRGAKKSESSTSSSSRSESRRVLRQLTHRLLNDTKTSTTSPMSKFTTADRRKLEFILTGRIMDKKDMNHAIPIILEIFKDVKQKFRGPKVIITETPATVITDIHGNLTMLLKIFQSYHDPFNLAWRHHRFIFTGDYVDRGANSLQVLLILFVLKLSYPDNIILLRGNHEDPKCNLGYGFFKELDKWFGEEVFDKNQQPKMVASKLSNVMKAKTSDVFSQMPLAAFIKDKKIFVCHGCVPVDLEGDDLIAAINALPDAIHDPRSFPLVEQLLWNDIGLNVHGYEPNHGRSGIGYLIGADKLEEVCKKFDINMIVRGHQVVSCGYESFAGGKVMLVFASADYVKDKNHGAVIDFTKDGYGLRIFVNIDRLRRKASKSEQRGAFLHIYSKKWQESGLKTSEQNKAIEKSKSKKIDEPKKAKENQIQDDNVKKKASQLEQADMKIDESEKTVFTVTQAPT